MELILLQAAQATPAAGAQNPIMGFLPFILMIVVFYFLLIRPQQKKQKEHQKLIDGVQVHDKVIISGGIYAKVMTIKNDKGTIVVEIDETNKTKMEVQKSSIVTVLPKNES